MLRQCLISRRCLILIDGLDEGDVSAAIKPCEAGIIPHVLDELLLQGHAVIATARPESAAGFLDIDDTGSMIMGTPRDGQEAIPREVIIRSAMRDRLWSRIMIDPFGEEQQKALMRQQLNGKLESVTSVQKMMEGVLKPLGSQSRTGVASMKVIPARSLISNGKP